MDHRSSPLARACAACALLLLTTPGLVGADPGGVDLVEGGRINGDVMSVLPGDGVTIRLADGSVVSVPWVDVAAVEDGARRFTSTGHRVVRAAPADVRAPLADTPSDRDRLTSARVLVALRSLPSRGGTLTLSVGGAIFAANGVGMIVPGAMGGCWDASPCGFTYGMVIGGVTSLAIGGVLIGRSVSRARRYAAGMRALRQRLGIDPSGLSLDLLAGRDGGVPQLTISF